MSVDVRCLQPVGRSASLTQQVLEAIENAIASRELKPGTRITESELATRLKVSKTPVREALLRLQFMGVIEPDGVRGGRVVMPSARGIERAYEIREGLEAQAARLAALKASPEQATAISRLADRSLAAARRADVAGFRKEDRAFHRQVAATCDNEQLAELIDNAIVLTWTLRLRDVPLADDSLHCAQQHQSVAAAIGAADEETAERAMRDHLQTVRTIVVQAFHSGSGRG